MDNGFEGLAHLPDQTGQFYPLHLSIVRLAVNGDNYRLAQSKADWLVSYRLTHDKLDDFYAARDGKRLAATVA